MSRRPPRSPLTTASVSLGPAHTPSSHSQAEADMEQNEDDFASSSPVANVDTVPSMNIPRSAFERRFHAKEEAFRDLSRFEEQLRSRLNDARTEQRRWQAGVLLLFLLLAWSTYRIVTNDKVNERGIPQQSSWHVFGVTVPLSAFIILLASGSMRAKLLSARIYTRRCNNALRPFNMQIGHSDSSQPPQTTSKDTPKDALSFLWKVPPEFREGYRQFRERREERKKVGGRGKGKGKGGKAA
ncbi:uncharacterized protein EV422DRAFT_159796 [Fimicolochytrium jonesii]|uniref:uncharacterized protein n=1 Tax=Fimicolochytrium jonesii TaxID=1396493 RepID=UPI0022FDDDD9|nr:uncharacterized protein EV422DRAFT_159796 [Fimicolochytrium jonesii]KAI8826257.1 hypothetical protein EV422DRAFT_159796 [Fimicolochytrium jonesii]